MNVSSTNTVRVELKVQSNRMRIPIPLDRVFEGRDQDFERALTQLLVPGARVCMAVYICMLGLGLGVGFEGLRV